jgi:ABC-type polysaccharide/polyol phosphate export permease
LNVEDRMASIGCRIRMITDEREPRPLQFGLKALFAITAAAAVLFGTLKWFEVPPWTIGLILVIALVSAIAALGLVVAIAAGRNDDPPG